MSFDIHFSCALSYYFNMKVIINIIIAIVVVIMLSSCSRQCYNANGKSSKQINKGLERYRY